MYKVNKERLNDKIKTYSTFGDQGNGGITRFSLSPEDIMARDEFVKRMTAIGAEITCDDMANMYATLPGSEPGLPRIVTGSHCDSVRNGGNYDGILGVLAAMEVLETIAIDKIPHRHPITAMIWTNEEGSFYPPAMMSSGVICVKFEKETMLASKSAEDTIFGETLSKFKYKGDEKNRLNANDYKAMVELHIEQGPILEAEQKDIGVVTCVIGMCNYRIKTYGQACHAGTTPMKYRKDALYAAAQLLMKLHEELDKLDPTLVYTTGEIICHPCVHTVIPDFVDFSIDARHEDPKVIAEVVKVIESLPEEIAKCRVETKRAWGRDTVYFDKELVDTVKKTADAFGYSNMRINSGAGHDAQFVAGIIPTTMIFVPSRDGHSHCTTEHTSIEQCVQGANVLLNTILEIDKK